MSDLLARLRAAAANDALGIGEAWTLLDEAADAIASLLAARDAALALLRECREQFAEIAGDYPDSSCARCCQIQIARIDAALEGLGHAHDCRLDAALGGER